MSKKEYILLLGCSGLISTVLAEKLLNAGYIVDAAGRKKPENIKVNFIKWDIFEDDLEFFHKLQNEYTAIIVSAWVGNIKDERDNSILNMSSARALEKNILKILSYAHVNQVVLMGSQAEYGEVCGKVDEKSIVNEDSLSQYGRAKLYLYEKLKESVKHTIVTELRFHSVYGFFSGKKQMLEDVMKSMFKDEKVNFYSNGLQHYDFLYVDDVADAIIASLKIQASGFYNVSSNSKDRFCTYIKKIKEITKSRSEIMYGKEKSSDFIFCSNKFKNETGWESRISFENGALKMFSSVVYEILKKNDIIIYGAGYCGLVFSDILLKKNISVKAFFDADCQKHGKSFNGIKICQAYECINPEDVVIVCMLTDKYYSEIKENLQKLGYRNIKFIYELFYLEELFEEQPLIFHIPKDWQKKNCEKIKLVNNLLVDYTSKSIYKEIIEFAAGNHSFSINVLPIEQQYFAYDIYCKNDNEIFIDCGAFKGDILKYFCENNSCKFSRYYAIEPDMANIDRIKQISYAKDERVQIVECALSNKPEILKMKNYLNENSVVCNNGVDVYANTLDNICQENNIAPTFIKIDVEGFEEKLLEGAVYTLKTYRPLIAIAIYHKCDDLWKLPLKIHELLPSHKLFMRSYMNINETILYAVPQERRANEIY